MKTIRTLILILLFAVFQSCGPKGGEVPQQPVDIHRIGNSYFSVFHLCEGTYGKIPVNPPEEMIPAERLRAGDILLSRM
ncbi:MAG TPA: hypothetical protein ENF21_01950 [Bacteroidetes bacterium]|nr:hypothetical protein [Bacteroidota bacterium]